MNPRKIKINFATDQEIDKLRGIGPKLAKRIVDDRDLNGFFLTPKDLDRVDGISLELAESLDPFINWDVPNASDVQEKRDWRQSRLAGDSGANEFDLALRGGVRAAHECRAATLRIDGGAAIAMAIARPLAP